MIKLYHNNRCSKSRCALEYLEEQHKDFEVVDLLKEKLSKSDLEELLKLLDMRSSELIRKEDAFFKENFGGKNYTEEEYLDIMLKNPRLIQRPIVVKNGKAVIGRPLENVEQLLG
ncbi:arsenate reductase (glutaredoxin) [Riemerella columbipharyngis]|uniref:Arsenate reductase n=1 Tax=Riemerella columbipharyngis TaxID=1071918 RepID=A0A1G7AU77_9FLAO|nr:arsenate reductase (glutaredoxin) [Riemerella columbipharyngis]SDE17555.1 arsenate reductase [Riemerella columbipharyngis]